MNLSLPSRPLAKGWASSRNATTLGVGHRCLSEVEKGSKGLIESFRGDLEVLDAERSDPSHPSHSVATRNLEVRRSKIHVAPKENQSVPLEQVERLVGNLDVVALRFWLSRDRFRQEHPSPFERRTVFALEFSLGGDGR